MVIIMQDRDLFSSAGHNKTVPIKERSVKGIFHQMHVIAQVQVIVKDLIEVLITKSIKIKVFMCVCFDFEMRCIPVGSFYRIGQNAS